MEDFYIGGAALTRPAGHPLPSDGRGAGGEGLNFPEIVDIALPAEGVFHNLVFVSIRKTYPMQAYKIMHRLWGMGQMMFTKYIVVVDDECLRTATRRSQHQRSPLPPLRQHRPATRQHVHQRASRCFGSCDV
jgi:hypothetical protein